MRVSLLVAALATLGLAGCGEAVSVPPAHYGKILSKDGFQPGLISPSRFRLPVCIFYCDKLILVEASDVGLKEVFRDGHALYMPRSELAMPFDVRGTFAVKNDERTLNAVFDRIPSQIPRKAVRGLAHGVVSQTLIYQTYGKPIVRDIVRQIVSKYKIEEVASSRQAINAELSEAINKALAETPLVARRIGLGDVRFPDIILKQKEAAAQRRIAIQQEEAEKQIRLVKLQADLEAARAERNIRREKAQAALEENEIFSKSVTPEYLAYRRLEVLERMANNQNTVFLPFEALSTVGISQRVFNPPRPDQALEPTKAASIPNDPALPEQTRARSE